MGDGFYGYRLKILANSRLTVNTFPLFPPEIFFTVNFFYD